MTIKGWACQLFTCIYTLSSESACTVTVQLSEINNNTIDTLLATLRVKPHNIEQPQYLPGHCSTCTYKCIIYRTHVWWKNACLWRLKWGNFKLGKHYNIHVCTPSRWDLFTYAQMRSFSSIYDCTTTIRSCFIHGQKGSLLHSWWDSGNGSHNTATIFAITTMMYKAFVVQY